MRRIDWDELGTMQIDEVDKARFWSKVRVKITNSAEKSCWEWTGRKHKNYGQFMLNRRCHYAPRVAWTIFFGDPGEMQVLHKCDNPPCVNPYHLFLGTPDDNVKDCINKGRYKYNIDNLNWTDAYKKRIDGKVVADNIFTQLRLAKRIPA